MVQVVDMIDDRNYHLNKLYINSITSNVHLSNNNEGGRIFNNDIQRYNEEHVSNKKIVKYTTL